MCDPDACFCPRTSRPPSMVLSGKALGVRRALQETAVDPQVVSETQSQQDCQEGTCHPQTGPRLNLELI